ncbi:MAG: hypothetical protein ACKOPQ_10055 [Novosphingobium sp.]|jgi:hypothetical protein
MEMGFAPSSLAANSAKAAQEAVCAPLEWHALKSRFLAAHALRQELEATDRARVARGGFVESGALALASLRESSDAVNLTASANGKPPFGIEANVTGTPTPMTEERYD